jgi:hypothetical protein
LHSAIQDLIVDVIQVGDVRQWQCNWTSAESIFPHLKHTIGAAMDREQKTIYKNHTVVCSANSDTIGFMPLAMVSWTPPSVGAVTIFIRTRKTYPSEKAAMDAALQEARSWIDNHLGHNAAVLKSGAATKTCKPPAALA